MSRQSQPRFRDIPIATYSEEEWSDRQEGAWTEESKSELDQFVQRLLPCADHSDGPCYVLAPLTSDPLHSLDPRIELVV